MIEIQQVKTKDEADYRFVEELMLTAFPEAERRDTPQQREYSDHHPLFRSHIVRNDEQPIGMVSYWDFGDFFYIEHFAISPSLRNGGYGGKVLAMLQEQLKKPIVLEVEEPTDELSTRRIGFYQRQGFTLHHHPYMQPPYRPSDTSFPMFLMSCGNLDMDKEFERVRDTLHREVYGVK